MLMLGVYDTEFCKRCTLVCSQPVGSMSFTSLVAWAERGSLRHTL